MAIFTVSQIAIYIVVSKGVLVLRGPYLSPTDAVVLAMWPDDTAAWDLFSSLISTEFPSMQAL